MFKRDFDWDIPSSTLGDWFAAICALLEPLYAARQRWVLATDYLQSDESRIAVLEWGGRRPRTRVCVRPTTGQSSGVVH
jgi:hypothetical protein